jgi:hypothetical protein
VELAWHQPTHSRFVSFILAGGDRSSPLTPGVDNRSQGFYAGRSPINNTPDSFLNEPTRLSGLAVQKLSYFFKASIRPDFEKKISATAG